MAGERLEDGRLVVMLSALQHFVYCPRRSALIHVEQTFDDNIYTLKGTLAHRRVHEAASEQRGLVRQLRGLTLYHDGLGLVGQADVVELRSAVPGGAPVEVVPIEHKLGSTRRAPGLAEEVQLCGQALCLEAMFQVSIREGAIFQTAPHRRRAVVFTEALRGTTLAAIEAVRAQLESGRLPPPVADGRCRACSLRDACQPSAILRMRDGAEVAG